MTSPPPPLCTPSVPFAEAGIGDEFWRDWTTPERCSAVAPFLRRNPADAGDRDVVLREFAGRSDSFPRKELADLTASRLAELDAPEAAINNARSLASPDAFAVITGQQPGLFGGPLYVLWKALTTVGLAAELSRQTGRRFVPIFWVADDDHDLQETNRFERIHPDGRLERLTLAMSADAWNRSVGEVTLPDDPSLSAQAWPADEWALLAPHYRPGRTFGEAFARFWLSMLGEEGLVTVEGSRLRTLGQNIFAAELVHWPETHDLLDKSGTALRTAGYTPGFGELRNGPNLFLSVNGRRKRLESSNGKDFHAIISGEQVTGGESPDVFSAKDLLTLCREAPTRFSPAAALRALMQSSLFPAPLVVVGPGELRYWAQLASLHDRREALWPMLFPRLSATFIDRRARRILNRMGVDPRDLFRPRSEWPSLTRGDDQQEPPSEKIETAVARIKTEMEIIRSLALETDSSLSSMLDRASGRLTHECGKISAKVREIEQRKRGILREHFEYLGTLIQPTGKPQERVLGTIPLFVQLQQTKMRAAQETSFNCVIEKLKIGEFKHKLFEF